MSVIDLLFPKFCVGCHRPGIYFCNDCANKLKPIRVQRCYYCYRPSFLGITHPQCQKSYSIDGLISFFYYNSFLKQIIKNIKYRLAVDVWTDFIKSILINQQQLIDFKVLISDCQIEPIPLTQQKQLNRGFNQSQLIANFFNQTLKFKQSNLLIRRKELKPQAEITDKINRMKNVSKSFSINKLSLKNQIPANILLVDDVVTTGATVTEATKVLKKYGVKQIYIMSLAHGY